MKRKQTTLKNALWIIIVIIISIIQVQSQSLPSKKQILEKLALTNSYFMEKWPDPSKEIITNKIRPSNIWTRAVYYEGLMGLYKLSPQKKYYHYAVQWGESHNWSLRNNVYTRNADDQACGQTYIDLYLIDPKPERIKDIKASMDNMVKNHTSNRAWSWIDAIQMAMPVFAKLGVIYKDTSYFEKMYDMYNFSKVSHGQNGLYNPVDHLWWRDKDFVPPYKEPNGEDCYWSRGNGWVFAALVRVLDILPKNDPHREEYVKTFKEMAEALVPIQRTDGFWNVSLHDSTNYGGKELSGTALFAYGMAWGVSNGFLDKKTYLPVITKAWNAMSNEGVHPNGFLGYVQGTGKEPKDGQPVTYTHTPDFEDYGLGCFLLAGSEVYKLAN